ncbi:DUF2567 domain-containing protein [Fodinicola feengrottensis]|uniref:DUF2567 domain-containing protein n=1 Tax=Fodinicola feengrottensis TaxID=435914 RepID=UPI0013D6215F|nr:DUF2567 domain-containing protein [Fodinicola feengrottensis]
MTSSNGHDERAERHRSGRGRQSAAAAPEPNSRVHLRKPDQSQPTQAQEDPEQADPYADWQPPALSIGRAFAVADLVRAGIAAAVLLVLGAPLGLLWSAIAPHAMAAQTAGGAIYTGFDNEVFVAADAVLGAIGLVVGILAGVGGYLWLSRRGPWMAIGLAVGGAAGSALAMVVGHQIGLATSTGWWPAARSAPSSPRR